MERSPRELGQSEDVSAYVRPLEGWELLGDPAADPVLRFERRWYRKPGGQPALARAEVEASALAPELRRALAAFVLLGTVSPTDAAAIAGEATAESSESGSESGSLRREPRVTLRLHVDFRACIRASVASTTNGTTDSG